MIEMTVTRTRFIEELVDPTCTDPVMSRVTEVALQILYSFEVSL